MPNAAPAESAHQRYEWLDYAKAMGIFLVVAAHVAGGIRKGPAGDALERVWFIVDLIYTFHMPLFFAISGYLFVLRPQMNWVKFAKASLIGIVVPYAVWGVLFVLIQNLFPGASNNLTDLSRIGEIFYHPIAHMWFLYVLFFVRIIYFLSLKVDRIYLLSVVLAVSVVAYALVIGYDRNAERWAMGFTFFGLGALLSHFGFQVTSRLDRLPLCLLVATTLWLVFALGVLFMNMPPVMLVFAAVFGVAMTLIAALLLPQSESLAARTLAYFGQASLAIYVAHTIFAAGIRAVFYKLGLVDPFLNLFAGIVVGMVMPAILFWFANSLRLAPYLGLGQNQSKLYLSLRKRTLISRSSAAP